MGTYRTLLSVSLEHGYNTSGFCSCLIFCATQKTQRIFNNTGLLLKNTANGIQIVYDESGLDALTLYAEDKQEPLCFVFKVYSSDPDFRSYTEPNTAVTNGLLYFDNSAASGSGKQRLSASSYVSTKDAKKLDSDELRDVLSHRDRLLPPVFVLKVFAVNHEGLLIQEWLKPEPSVYTIAFRARQRYWKYYLLGSMVNPNRAHKDFYVFDPDKRIEFEAMEEESLADRSVAYTFRTKQSIPLNERYAFRFQLREKKAGAEKIVIDALPVAGIKQVGKEASAEAGALVSEIYINS